MIEHCPLARVQVVPGLKVPPDTLADHETVPLGVVTAPGLVSATVAVNVTEPSTRTVELRGLTVELVLRMTTERGSDPELAECDRSPA